MALTLLAGLSACATDEISRAPARPDQAWTVPQDSDYVSTLRQASRQDAARAGQPNLAPAGPAGQGAAGTTDEQGEQGQQDNAAAPQNRAQIELGRRYTLPDLIDIAERLNPETREAWEKARQAALSVGLAEHTYLPELTVSVLAGYIRYPFPMPKAVAPAGFITFQAADVLPTLALKWLLFDFGQTGAKVQEAEAKSFTANVTFTEAHEKIVFAVSREYFALGAARAHVRVAQYAAENARRTQEISEAKRAQGVATVVEVAQARRHSAQTRFELVRTQGAERNAYSALVASMGVDPNGTIEVADSSERPLPAVPPGDVRALIEKALVNRPDVIAALGNVRTAEAKLRGAKAAYWPTLKLDASLFGHIGGWSSGGPFFTVAQPAATALIAIDLPVFDGGALQANVATARSEVTAARAALDQTRDKAVEEVTHAYDQLQTSLAESQAAGEVDEAARTAFDAAVDAYRMGVGPLTDAITAANAASESQLQKENARASVLTSAAELAFALGSAVRK
jgi:outer membrane protein TolC